MKKLMALLLASAMLLSACGSSNDKPATSSSKSGTTSSQASTTSSKTEDKKDTPVAAASTEMKAVYSSEDTSHNYLKESLSTITEYSYTIVDGLVGFDKYGRSRPLGCTSYTVSEDGLTYTFKIREGVKWYTHDKKEYADVTANDYVYGVKYVLNKDNASNTCNLVYDTLAGAKDFYDGKNTDFSTVGIKAVDDYTLEYKLTSPAPYFLTFLSYGCWYPANEKFITEELENPQMFATSNDTMLYNGAYITTSWDHESSKVRELNENYWDKEGYTLTKITDTYNKEAGTISADLFLRGEVTSAGIGTAVADDWMNTPEKKAMVSYAPVSQYSWQYFINFDPQYDAEYKPEQWVIAANNLNFRKSLWHGVDVERTVKAIYPYTWDGVISATPTLPGMFDANGTDYTQQPALAGYKPLASFDLAKAKDYKTKAMEELKGKVDFPISVVYPHTTDQTLTERAVVFEQMLEENLGKDFVDVVLVSYPPTGFTSKIMGTGKWSFGSKGWGPDYADPASTLEMYTDNEGAGETYAKTFKAEGFAPIQAKFDAAMAEKVDNNKRMQLFSEAEAMILDGAYSLPIYRTGGGLVATYRDPFSQDSTQFGRNTNKLNRVKLLPKPMGFDEYGVALKKWEAEKVEAAKDPDANWK